MDVFIAVELVAEIISQLGEESGVDEELRPGIDACFALGGVLEIKVSRWPPTARRGGRESIPGRQRNQRQRHRGLPGWRESGS